MKAIIFTMVAFICTFSHANAQQQRIRIGHRDVNQVAVLDIGISQISPAIIQSIMAEGFTNVRVIRLDISDNAANPNYYASMGVTVSYQKTGETDFHTLTYLYPIIYDPIQNSYFGGHVELSDIKDGANKGNTSPDNNFCVAYNCVGCTTLRDLNGKTTGCGICVPTNEKPYMCYVSNSAGEAAVEVLKVLAGLLNGLVIVL